MLMAWDVQNTVTSGMFIIYLHIFTIDYIYIYISTWGFADSIIAEVSFPLKFLAACWPSPGVLQLDRARGLGILTAGHRRGWQWKNKHLKMYLLSKMVIFHCHVGFWRCTLHIIHIYIAIAYIDIWIYLISCIYIYMAGVQNSRSQGLYAVRRVGIEQLILHFGYEAGRN